MSTKGTTVKALVTFDMNIDNQKTAIDVVDTIMFELFKRNKDLIDKITFDWK